MEDGAVAFSAPQWFTLEIFEGIHYRFIYFSTTVPFIINSALTTSSKLKVFGKLALDILDRSCRQGRRHCILIAV